MTQAPAPSPDDAQARRWAPRIWAGCSVGSWWRLLRRYRFAVSPSHLYIAVIDSLASALNSSLGVVEGLVYGRRIRRHMISSDPIFIIGHWRTGTTLLHELLCLDCRHAGPSTYACMAPHHFLLTERVFPRVLRALCPTRRPMDDMAMGFDSPFEDEFALCLLGARSPYETIAFPNAGDMTPEMLDPRSFGPAEYERWRRYLVRFYRKLSVRHPDRRLIFKSPPHTCRIPTLLELFPRARFVHVVRDPYRVFPSTLHLWRTLHRVQGLQQPNGHRLDPTVFSIFLHMQACVDRDRPLVPPGQFHELRYEDLVRQPADAMQRLYEDLHLEDFSEVRPAVEAYFAARSGYAPNRYPLDEEEREAIRRNWGEVIRKYGYDR